MKFLLLLCYILFVCFISNSADEEGDYCLFKSNRGNITVKRGENLNVPNACMLLKCDQNRMLSVETCPDMQTPKDPLCRLVEGDLKRSYPYCCPAEACA